MKYFYHIISVVCAGLFMLMSCADEDAASFGREDSNKIILRFDVPGSVHGRSLEDINAVGTRESLLHSVDIFIYEVNSDEPEGGSMPVHYERIVRNETGGNSPILYTLDIDKDGFSNTYKIYVVANIPEGELTEDKAKGLSFTDFKNYHLEEEGGCNPYGTDGQSTYYFLMDGSSDVVKLNEVTAPVPVSLSRAAAKIEVTVKLGEELSENYIMGTATAGWEQTPSTVFLNRDGLLQDLRLVNSPQSSTSIATIGKTESEPEKKKLVLYTYSNQWTEGEVDEETYIVFNLPLNAIEGAGEDIKDLSANYYKIKVGNQNNSTNQFLIARNTLYRINITVDIPGTTEWEDPTELEAGFSIYPWGEEGIDIDGGGNMHYLMLSEDAISFSNTNENMTVEYLSSSEISSVVISDVYWLNSSGEKIYYKNYSSLTSYMPEAKAENGHIHITSKLPGNNAPKHFTVTVTNKNGDQESFTVVQYPLEYITFEEGWYSSMDELWNYRYELNKSPGAHNCTKSYTRDRSSTPYWYSKVSKGNHQTYNYSWTSATRKREDRYNTFDNNRMYHVQITRTSDDHVIAVPEINPETGWTDSSKENNKKVSPSFMLASQLGGLKEFLPHGDKVNAEDGNTYYEGYIDAANHCKDYIEVKADGTIYDDWRLPTLAELQIIAKYQYAPSPDGYPSDNDNKPIAPVLTDTSNGYWSATGNDILKPQNRQSPYYTIVNPNNSRGRATIRCVRDVKPIDGSGN